MISLAETVLPWAALITEPGAGDSDLVLVIPWLLPPLLLLVGIALGYGIHALLVRTVGRQLHQRATDIVKAAEHEAETILNRARDKAELTTLEAREVAAREYTERRRELERFEERLSQRDLRTEQRAAMLEKKEAALDAEIAEYGRLKAELSKTRQEASALTEAARRKLEEVAALTVEEARRQLLQRTEEEGRTTAGHLLKKLQDEARREADRHAREIIVTCIERFAAAQASEVTTSTVSLPSEDMKGRIIGRDGRNIRSLEAETGCNILIDDTPETVVISGFDPLRREVARRTIERLIADGRVHPARIEEVAAAAKEEVETIVREAGESALAELRLTGVAPEVVRTLGLLKYRHSFNQNVLQHSIETAHLMGMMASEIGLDPAIARRVGLFHDIGKALDHKIEGNHAAIGADFLKRHGESALVCHAVGAHHHESENGNIYASLAAAADAITAARPGARLETTEIYLKRLAQIEAIANSFEGVKTSYAVFAGRELRVIVSPEKVDDNGAIQLARQISHRIEEQVRYPGQIRVTVIRETRCVEYAR